jgi:hypothetical protein
MPGSGGRRRQQALFARRILPFDDKAGRVWARLMAEGKAAGRPRSGLDIIIAAVAGSNDCVVVTDSERDFVGLRIVNPMREGASSATSDPSTCSSLMTCSIGAAATSSISQTESSQFFAEEPNIDIDGPVYARNGGSKAKRLRCFFQTVKKATVVRTLQTI